MEGPDRSATQPLFRRRNSPRVGVGREQGLVGLTCREQRQGRPIPPLHPGQPGRNRPGNLGGDHPGLTRPARPDATERRAAYPVLTEIPRANYYRGRSGMKRDMPSRFGDTVAISWPPSAVSANMRRYQGPVNPPGGRRACAHRTTASYPRFLCSASRQRLSLSAA